MAKLKITRHVTPFLKSKRFTLEIFYEVKILENKIRSDYLGMFLPETIERNGIKTMKIEEFMSLAQENYEVMKQQDSAKLNFNKRLPNSPMS